MERIRTLASIKKDLENHVGEKVTLKANGGRRRILVNEGILESVYPSIFVIRLKPTPKGQWLIVIQMYLPKQFNLYL